MQTRVAHLFAAVSAVLLAPGILAAPPTHASFDLATPQSGPFPSDRFTVADPTNTTGLRVHLPMPDCVQRPSDCEDVAVINTLDGFNVQPRLSIPFDGPIDVQSVTSHTVFLLKLPCAHSEEGCDHRPTPLKVGINQVVWDTFSNTLHVESDELLDQHASYALIVTNGVRDPLGAAVGASPAFHRFTHELRAAPPRTIIDAADGLLQTFADLMQLVRVIEVGVDADGDTMKDLDPSRLYYFGQSLGGIYGTAFLAVEPQVRAGVPNVPGGALGELQRLSAPGGRPIIASRLAARQPSLLNDRGILGIDGVQTPGPYFFNENVPLRDGVPLAVSLSDGTSDVIQSPVVNTVVGAMEIQEYLDRTEWVMQAANAVVYSRHLLKTPLDGVPAKPVIIQFARGDLTVPNPTTTAMLRAGDFADRATYFRNDIAFAENSAVPRNPHGIHAHAWQSAPARREYRTRRAGADRAVLRG